MQLLTNEIAKVFDARCIRMISLLKFEYIVRLALQLVRFEQLLNVFKKAMFEKITPFIRLFLIKARDQTFFLRKLEQKFFSFYKLNDMGNSDYGFRLI